MNKRTVFHLVSMVTLVIGLAMGVCAALSYSWNDPVWVIKSLLVSSVMTVLMAALISTIASALNALSTVFTLDVYQKRFRPFLRPKPSPFPL